MSAAHRPTVVETDRLLLRPFRPSDIDAYREIRAKPHLTRYLPGGEAAAEQADQKACDLVSAWSESAWRGCGFAPWAVEERASGRLVGHLGLRRLDAIDAVELLYLLDDGAQGRGYAREGGSAALEFARTTLGLDRVIALAMPENTASIAVMTRLGMAFVGARSLFGLEVVEYEARFG